MILPRPVCVCSSGVTDAHIKWIGYNCAIFLSILHFSLCFLEFVFLSDPSPIIGFACHSLTDVTLACDDNNLKLGEVVTVADVDDEDRIGNSLLQIWKVSFGHKAKLFLDFELKVWSRF